ncbi:MAG: hypothetical protein BWY46_00975 [Firmicutes bacterium ADurb.Bin300]|nr:MAG: hypothetical protein BWY46_00975 [Firmicutes bacterium ADurb.Bin300]HOD02922.1 hypothetical protein [Clostridiales bacterium]
MKRYSIFLICLIIAVLSSFNISAFAYSSAASGIVSNAAESPKTESSEIVLSIDVTERYTDGYNQGAEDDGTLSAGKIVFIGIVCLLLITGIIIIAVKSRYDEDGENDR